MTPRRAPTNSYCPDCGKAGATTTPDEGVWVCIVCGVHWRAIEFVRLSDGGKWILDRDQCGADRHGGTHEIGCRYGPGDPASAKDGEGVNKKTSGIAGDERCLT